ncbi:MAG TPA: HAMP domain-containing sensor histidine kinase [Planctomycetota bacterium]|nr:HAMP domain-containing sensor histidine kinase [Planctomycetota bacterium]HRR82266.1 HAMP domain-containing sensor histidine kinase [Planctomycetota bacterium]HRT94222.1 HAMP domain-containing sensor histidine kinase [Planctomycetota bacterium]
MDIDGTEASLRAALARLRDGDSLSWSERQGLAVRLGDCLRAVSDPGVLEACSAVYRILIADEKWEVRKAAAESLLHLQTDDFDGLVARLLDDPNVLVRRAAERTLARRKKVAQLDALKRERLEGIYDQYEAFVSRYGQAAADRALKLGERFFELLASAATHEIRGILTSLCGALDGLGSRLQAAGIPASAYGEHLRKAQERAGFLGSVLNDMKSYAQEPTHEFRVEKLREMIEEGCRLAEDQLRPEGHLPQDARLINRTPDYISVEAARYQLIQAFANVVKNAFEALEKDGRVEIDARLAEGNRAEVTIADNGVGMDEADRRDAFIPFRTSKKNQGGTGFGLPIAKKSIEAHGGSISLSSVDGGGTTVTILLPLQQGERAEE